MTTGWMAACMHECTVSTWPWREGLKKQAAGTPGSGREYAKLALIPVLEWAIGGSNLEGIQ